MIEEGNVMLQFKTISYAMYCIEKKCHVLTDKDYKDLTDALNKVKEVWGRVAERLLDD